jgi:ssDNA-binding Zn-finger/Zn-ribbon topoisomerase 1
LEQWLVSKNFRPRSRNEVLNTALNAFAELICQETGMPLPSTAQAQETACVRWGDPNADGRLRSSMTDQVQREAEAEMYERPMPGIHTPVKASDAILTPAQLELAAKILSQVQDQEQWKGLEHLNHVQSNLPQASNSRLSYAVDTLRKQGSLAETPQIGSQTNIACPQCGPDVLMLRQPHNAKEDRLVCPQFPEKHFSHTRKETSKEDVGEAEFDDAAFAEKERKKQEQLDRDDEIMLEKIRKAKEEKE